MVWVYAVRVIAVADAGEHWVTNLIDWRGEVLGVVTLPGYAVTDCVALSGATRLTPKGFLSVSLIPSDATAGALAVFHKFKLSAI